MNPTPVAWMAISELKAIVSRSHTITFAKRMRRASEDEILNEMLSGLNEHIAPQLRQTRADALREAAEKMEQMVLNGETSISEASFGVQELRRMAAEIEGEMK